jgi:hypothetical protein
MKIELNFICKLISSYLLNSSGERKIMPTKKMAVLVLICIFAIASAASVVAIAGTATEVSIRATNTLRGHSLNQFNPGTTIYICWSASPSEATVDISITDMHGNIISSVPMAQRTSNPIAVTNLPPGNYLINA